MWAVKSVDVQELAAYRALGSVDDLTARLQQPYPDSEDLSPLPWSDPAQDAVAAYEDEWDDSVAAGVLDEEG